MAWRCCSADQHRVARHATASHPEELGRTSARCRVGPARRGHGTECRRARLETIWVIGENERGDRPSPFVQIALPERGEPVEAAPLADGDPFVILYTSGTSGLSKGVVCPHAQFFWWGTHTGADLEVRAGDVLYTCLPLFHTNALNSFFQALMHDAQLVVDRRFSASGFFDSLVSTRATVTYVLGAMIPILLSRPPSPQEREHNVRVALAPGVPPQFQDAFTARCGIGLVDGYGSTETNSVIGGRLSIRRAGFMGKLAPGFDARVVDENDQPVPDGEAGELILRANQPLRLRAAISACRKRPSKPGATSGFTRAIAWCEPRTAISASSTA